MVADNEAMTEVQKLDVELKYMQDAQTTTDACKAIQEFVGNKIVEDKLAGDSKDNKYHQAPGGKGGCCIVM